MMVRWVVGGTVVISLFLLGLIVSVLVLGNLLAVPVPSVMAANACDLPCVFGVTPGVTNRDDAITLYEAIASQPSSFLTQLERSFTIGTDAPNAGFTIALVRFERPVGGAVLAVRLYEMSSSIQLGTVGDLLLEKQEPTRVYSTCERDAPILLLLFADGAIARIEFEGRLLPSTPLKLFAISADMEATLPPLLASFGCTRETTWHGFAPAWVYQTAES